MEKSPTNGFDLPGLAQLEINAEGYVTGWGYGGHGADFCIRTGGLEQVIADKTEYVVEWTDEVSHSKAVRQQSVHDTYPAAKFTAVRLAFITKAKDIQLFKRSIFETNREDFNLERATAMLSNG